MSTYKNSCVGHIRTRLSPKTFTTTKEKTWLCSSYLAKNVRYHAHAVDDPMLTNGITDLATPIQKHNLYLTLLTLLFSYAYDSRTMQHEPTSESAWTICALTPAFSALDPPPYGPSVVTDNSGIFTESEITATLAQSYRRSLAFPLYRSFALAEKCRLDVASFLAGGKRVVFRCLLELKDILDHHDVYYIYSKLWVEDFCLWIQAYAAYVFHGHIPSSLILRRD